jgi:hypothetical protein
MMQHIFPKWKYNLIVTKDNYIFESRSDLLFKGPSMMFNRGFALVITNDEYIINEEEK